MSEAPERILVESECGHANAYNSEDRRTWLHFPDNAQGYFCAEYVRADRIEELEAKLAKAELDKRDAISTLNAWFDRRKLAHAAIDQAVVDAASGYLRTSRSGGMPSEESDLVLGVIQDMARLSVFADLFARTTLAELTSSEAAYNEAKGCNDE